MRTRAHGAQAIRYVAFTLEHPVDEAKAQARYENGVLELTLPKSEAAMPKRIAVH